MGILRDVFGPSKDEIWSQLSREIGADYQKGGYFKSGKVTLSHGQWVITLDLHTVSSGRNSSTFTRIRAPYVNADGFRFNVYSQTIFSRLGKLLGDQDILVGDPSFDDHFVIDGSPEDSIKRLLSNETIRQLIAAQPDVHFEVLDSEGWFGASFPAGVDELRFETYGVLKDEPLLKQLFDLFAVVLDELCRMGSAYAQSPGVTL
jgi:hypothetical protein